MPRVLIIEDDPALRRALRIFLEKSGHTVVEAHDGQVGLKAHAAQTFDLIVTDLIMPEMDGVGLICALRKSHPTLPVIAISGGGRMSPENYLHIARQCGAAVVLAKPFAMEKLGVAIDQLLAKKAG